MTILLWALLLYLTPLLLIMAVALPWTLQPYSFDEMPRFNARDLKAGDVVLLRYDGFSGGKALGFFTHIMLCYSSKDGTVLTTEASPLKLLDVDGTEKYVASRLPEESIAKYEGRYCVRRLKSPLSVEQDAKLLSAVEERRNGSYDDLLFVSYWAGLTPFAFAFSHDQRFYCSEYVTTLLNKVFDNSIAHPLLKTPSTYASRYRSFLDVLQLTNMKSAIDDMYTSECVPEFS